MVAAAAGMVACLSLSLPAMVIRNHAQRGGDGSGVVAESAAFEEDYLFLGEELSFSGEAEDLVFVGKELFFNGTTQLGLFAVGEKVVYSGRSGNGIMAGCADLTLDGTVAGNSFVGCKSLHLREQALVDGNLFVGCGTLRLDGTINGDLYAGARKVVIDGVVNGNVNAWARRVVIGDSARILGNLTYSAKHPLTDEEMARIGGVVRYDEKRMFDERSAMPPGMAKWIGTLARLAMFVSFVVVGSLLRFLPVFRNLDARRSERAFWKTALWGIIPLLAYPAVVVLCFALIVTIPFAFVLLLASIPLLFFASVIGTTLTGQYIATKFRWNIEKRHYHFLIGALAAGIVSMIPVVGFLGSLFISSLGFGIYLSFLTGRDLTQLS